MLTAVSVVDALCCSYGHIAVSGGCSLVCVYGGCSLLQVYGGYSLLCVCSGCSLLCVFVTRNVPAAGQNEKACLCQCDCVWREQEYQHSRRVDLALA